jgi:hypothetical protein
MRAPIKKKPGKIFWKLTNKNIQRNPMNWREDLIQR